MARRRHRLRSRSGLESLFSAASVFNLRQGRFVSGETLPVQAVLAKCRIPAIEGPAEESTSMSTSVARTRVGLRLTSNEVKDPVATVSCETGRACLGVAGVSRRLTVRVDLTRVPLRMRKSGAQCHCGDEPSRLSD